MRRSTLSDTVLGLFEQQCAAELIEFSKSLVNVDADFLVFMARKSLCLYDSLVALGAPPVQRTILSDRTLDLQSRSWQGKRVALIDDTLISGYSLAAKKRFLADAGADVAVHVFCADKDWWCRGYVIPDSCRLYLDDPEVMAFCTAEVRTFSLVPRPYQVDFPLSSPLVLPDSTYGCTLSAVGWTAIDLTTPFQRQNDVFSFTFLPQRETRRRLANALGPSVASCIDIAKVRLFSRRATRGYSVQAVPMVTLAPVTEQAAHSLLRAIVEQIQGSEPVRLEPLVDAVAGSPKAAQRLVQYILSVALLGAFVEDVMPSRSPPVSLDEACRHYGPELRYQLDAIHRQAHTRLWPERPRPTALHRTWVKPSDLPEAVRGVVPEGLTAGPQEGVISERTDSPQAQLVNLTAEASEVFLRLHYEHELPARREARDAERTYHERLLDAPLPLFPHRSRLERGIPWSSLTQYLCRRCGWSGDQGSATTDLLSLVLDVCNDVGVAVPVTCIEDGVVFRAYRHGEDVQFSDSELVLAREAISGCLDSCGRDALPKGVLEKLLVLLLKVGAAQGFLEPWWGASGADGTARVAFYLHGAVPKLVVGPREHADRDMWLSNYLLRRGVLATTRSSQGQYILGPNAQSVSGNVGKDRPHEAWKLGWILGKVLKFAADPDHARAPLDWRSLVVLTSCGHPRDAAAALQAELHIFQQWASWLAIELDKVHWGNDESIRAGLRALHAGHGQVALQSAEFKFAGYQADVNPRTIEACARHLERLHPHDPIPARTWESYWKAMTSWEAPGERGIFTPLIRAAASLCWEGAALVFALELSLRLGLTDRTASPIVDLRKAGNKLRNYGTSMVAAELPTPKAVEGVSQYFRKAERQGFGLFDNYELFSFATSGLSNLTERVVPQVEAMELMVSHYGRGIKRIDYTYLVWYDLINSTGEKSTGNVEEYCGVVDETSHALNRMLRTVSRMAKGCELHAWNGDFYSSNDEKHIFISGAQGISYAQSLVTNIIRICDATRKVRARVLVVPCDFVGSGVHRMDGQPEVEGERFWQHLTRLRDKKGGFKELVTPYGDSRTLLGIATQALIRDWVLPADIAWAATDPVAVHTQIQGLRAATHLQYGPIRSPN